MSVNTRFATGTVEPASTSVPPAVTVNVAMYMVLLDLESEPKTNPPTVPEVRVYVSPPSSSTVIVALTSSPIFIAESGIETPEITGAVVSITTAFVVARAGREGNVKFASLPATSLIVPPFKVKAFTLV